MHIKSESCGDEGHAWEEVEVIGESGHCEGCGRSGWYLVIKGGDVGSQEEIGRIRVRLRLYWGVEVGGEEYIGNGTGLLRIVIIFH